MSRVSLPVAPVPSNLSAQPATSRPPRFKLQRFSLLFCNSFQLPNQPAAFVKLCSDNLEQHQRQRISTSATNSIQVVLVSQSAQQLPSSNQFNSSTVDQQSVSHQEQQLQHSFSNTPISTSTQLQHSFSNTPISAPTQSQPQLKRGLGTAQRATAAFQAGGTWREEAATRAACSCVL